MGVSSSKATRTVAGGATRKYPSRNPNQPAPTSQQPLSAPSTSTFTEPHISASESQPGPTVHSKARPSETRTKEIDLDARDPHLAGRLSELGPVKPYPTFSPSSTSSPLGDHDGSGHHVMSPFGRGNYPTPASNPAIAILSARSRIQQAVEKEKIDAGRSGFEGRQYLDIATIRKVLTLRDEQGMKKEDIEKALRLKKGTVDDLGRVGVFEAA